MKQIEAKKIWFDGLEKEAKWFNVIVSAITLGVGANISFELFEGQIGDGEAIGAGTKIYAGQLSMNGDDYTDWDTDDDYVWTWAANKLGLVIIPQQENI
jgi:hypothetical protein